jgi:hypothetical protein
MPASAASRIASAANGGGTKIIAGIGAGVAHGILHRVVDRQPDVIELPPLPGVTPPTSLVPYSSASARRGRCPAGR